MGEQEGLADAAIVTQRIEEKGLEWDFAEVTSLGDGDEDGVGVSAPGGHAAAGDFPLEDTLADDVLAVVVVGRTAGQEHEREDAFALALHDGDDCGEDGVGVFPGQEAVEAVLEEFVAAH